MRCPQLIGKHCCTQVPIPPASAHEPPTMILLIGMNTSLTVYPMKPMMEKPMAHATAIFLNSFASGFVHLWTSRRESWANSLAPWTQYPTGLVLSVRNGIIDNLAAMAGAGEELGTGGGTLSPS